MFTERVGGAQRSFPSGDVFLERPAGQTVDLDAPAQLNCTANDSTASVQWRHDGRPVTEVTDRVRLEPAGVRIVAATWSDIGVYTCNVTLNGRVFSASATLNITGIANTCI